MKEELEKFIKSMKAKAYDLSDRPPKPKRKLRVTVIVITAHDTIYLLQNADRKMLSKVVELMQQRGLLKDYFGLAIIFQRARDEKYYKFTPTFKAKEYSLQQEETNELEDLETELSHQQARLDALLRKQKLLKTKQVLTETLAGVHTLLDHFKGIDWKRSDYMLQLLNKISTADLEVLPLADLKALFRE